MGAWIEMHGFIKSLSANVSLPSWERGLKSKLCVAGLSAGQVAPLVGAWIEIDITITKKGSAMVAPLVGAWIEIKVVKAKPEKPKVAPLVGAWIEMPE